ncbi:MAG: DNA-binding protein WhiA [Lachnospiraceae bacterium]|nr:DNA-binding protein WhiA [Lachnospiraceae bacterium]
MSFSHEVKRELLEHIDKQRDCRVAELSAILMLEGVVDMEEPAVYMHTENQELEELYGHMVRLVLPKEFEDDINPLELHGEPAGELLSILKWRNSDAVNGLLIQQEKCKKAFIRGAFLSNGSMSDPEKSYHFEIVCDFESQAKQIQDAMRFFHLDAKIVSRKNHSVVYLKEGAQVSTALSVMEASISMMNFENIRIVKEMRNSVNRSVNCETANIKKTVNAAVRQVEAIEFIESKVGLSSLPDNLQKIAEIRLTHPETPLKELGELLDPPVGKSGVNHRLRRIVEIADKLKLGGS